MSEGNGFVTREQLLAKTKRRYDEFEVRGLGKIRVRSLTERERSDYESATISSKGGLVKSRLLDARRRLIVLTVVDGEGNAVLNELSDVKTLEDSDGAIMEAIYERAAVHCGIKDSDIDDLVKNSESVHVEG